MFHFFKKKAKIDPDFGAPITPALDHAYERYKNEFLQYLENRYQKKFLPIALYPEMEFLEFRAYPEGGDKIKDEIHLYMHDYATKNHIIDDNYFFETIRDEYDAYIRGVAKDYFQSFNVFYRKQHHYPRDLKPGDTWEYIRTHNSEYNFPFEMDHYIFTDDTMDEYTFKKRFYDLMLKLYNENVSGYVAALNVKKGYLQKINDDNAHEYLDALVRKYKKAGIWRESDCITKPELWDMKKHDRKVLGF